MKKQYTKAYRRRVTKRQQGWGIGRKIAKAWAGAKDLLLAIFLLNILFGQIHDIAPATKHAFAIRDIAPEVQAEEEPIKQEEKVVDDIEDPAQEGEFSAYTARQEETDGNPTGMASGKTVHDGAIANNCLAFGTQVEVAGKIYTVEDRMNRRYGCEHFDIYMESYDAAIQFGRRKMEYRVIEETA